MEKIAISNRKGGVGKTTTAVAMAQWLADQGAAVLLVDLDTQANATCVVKGNPNAKRNAHSAMLEECDAHEAVQHIAERLDLLPASKTAVDTVTRLAPLTGNDRRLAAVLGDLQDEYDYCVIDTPPALDLLTVNALGAADYLLATTTASNFGIDALDELVDNVSSVKKYTNPTLQPIGVLITSYDGRSNAAKQLRELAAEAAAHLGTEVITTAIREGKAGIEEATANQVSIFEYQKIAKVAADYAAAFEEIIERMD